MIKIEYHEEEIGAHENKMEVHENKIEVHENKNYLYEPKVKIHENNIIEQEDAETYKYENVKHKLFQNDKEADPSKILQVQLISK